MYIMVIKGIEYVLSSVIVPYIAYGYDNDLNEPGESLSLAGSQSVLLTLLTNPSQHLRVTRLNVYGQGNHIHQLLNINYKTFISNPKKPLTSSQLNNPHPTD